MSDQESFSRESENWDEFEWEKLMRKSDLYAHEYMRLFERFGDLPVGEDLIMHELKSFDLPQFVEDDFDIEISSDDFEDIDLEMEKPYFETDKSYILLRQVSIGWCNIFATLLNMEHRPYGVRIIFHLGRALAYYQGALADGVYAKPESFIAATKRCLDNVNKAIGEIDDLGRKRDVYDNVTKSMKGHLRQVHDNMIDHLNKLRAL